ncbi:6-phosphofructokinase 1 [Planctomycetes bacterium MalM25]|nr:6-phosphofructokinase 1 [Planctomycetes bacterium MalM25]
MSKKRIGILTSGGDCPGLNAVIRGAVKASHQLGYDCVGFLKGYEGLYDPVQYVHLTPDSTRGILNQGGTILGSTNKGRFAATVGVQDRQELEPRLVEGVKQTIDQLGIDGLICVGGDGSLAVAQQFHEQGIPVVGVPKTIDNDLSATAFTFGFDSAIECATDALDRLHTTGSSHERIMVLEVMGRHAGWIALHAGIAGGGDVILIPEIEWNYDDLCHKILHRESQGKKFTLIVVAEGAELPSGELVGEQRSGQQMKLGGVGRAVTEEIQNRLHREARLCVLGHLQRGGKPTTFDRVLATQFGAHAVRLVKEGRFGEMICSRPPEMTSVPIMEAVNELRQVDAHGPAVQAARALGISFGDRKADEIGEGVFDRLEPVSHVPEFVEHHPEAFADGAEEATAEATPVIEEAVAEVAPEETTAVVEAVSEEVALVEETPAEPEPVAETETAEGEVVEEAAPSVESPEVAVTEEPATETAVAMDEDQAAETVAETILDMVSDADEAIHGEVAEPENEPEETDPAGADPEREPELPETDEAPSVESVETAAPTLTPPSLEEADLGQASEALAAEAEEPAPPAAPAMPALDTSALQAQLADQISGAAKEKRGEAPNDPTFDAETSGLSVAELVKQKLAAASITPQSEATLEEPVDKPHDEDLVAEARSALEAALSD